MQHQLCQGILMGLVLAAMAGPILFTLLQTSLDHGYKKGMLVGLGVWTSDLLFVVAVFNALKFLNQLIQHKDFEFYTGSVGGLILFTVGLGMILNDRKKNKAGLEIDSPKKMSFFQALMKGFLINTVNPFTFIFWTGIISSELGSVEIIFSEVAPFIIALITTIVLTDSLKIVLASRVRKYLTAKRISYFRLLSGGALLIFGIALFVKVAAL